MTTKSIQPWGVILTLLLTVPVARAERIAESDAAAMAARFAHQSAAMYPKAPARVIAKAAYTARAKGENLFYVFNNAGDTGFTIVSGDDELPQILGYTTSGTFDYDRIPDNMKGFLEGYAREIAWYYRNSSPQRVISDNGRHVIEPMLTTTWDQGSPYNRYCPTDENGNNLWTGCVATATAQVLRYFQWPDASEGVVDGTDLSQTTYKYDEMRDSYSHYDTGEESHQVATLMRNLGIALHMNYSAGGSGAHDFDIQRVLIENFKYNPGTSLLFRDYSNTKDWDNAIYGELAAGRPVIMCGQATGGGHCFVIDGYASENYYHLNWGWGGYQDGYFRVYLLNPETGGAGSFEGGYNSNQSIITKMTPRGKADTATQALLVANGQYRWYTDEDGYPGIGFTNDGMIYNPLGITQIVNMAMEFRNCETGEITLDSWSEDFELPTYYGFGGMTFEKPTLPDGEYEVRLVLRASGSEDYSRVKTPNGTNDYLLAQVKEGEFLYADVEQPSSAAAQLVATRFEGLTDVHSGEQTGVRVTITNLTDTDWNGLIAGAFSAADVDYQTVVIPGKAICQFDFCVDAEKTPGTTTFRVKTPKVSASNPNRHQKWDDAAAIPGSKTIEILPAVEDSYSENPTFRVSQIGPRIISRGEDSEIVGFFVNTTDENRSYVFDIRVYDKDMNFVHSIETSEVKISSGITLAGKIGTQKLFDLDPGKYYVNIATDGEVMTPRFPFFVTERKEDENLSYTVTAAGEPSEAMIEQPLRGVYAGDVVIPDASEGLRFTALDGTALTYADQVTSLTLPASIESIGAAALRQATSLTSLTMLGTVPPVADELAFPENNANISVNLPEGTANSYARTQGWDGLHIPSWTILCDENCSVTNLDTDPATSLIYQPYYVSSGETLTLALNVPDMTKAGANITLSDGTASTLYPENGIITLPALLLRDGTCRVFADVSGINEITTGALGRDIYTATGILLKRAATDSDIDALPAGLYIVGGRKFIKR